MPMAALDAFLKACRAHSPRVALILGSGLGDVAKGLSVLETIPFGEVPDMAAPTVPGHKGQVHLGTWAGQRVLLFQGRLHYYEGHPWRRVEQGVALARQLDAKILLQINAVGGIRPDLVPGSLLPIRDHIEWTQPNSWSAPGPGRRASPYSPRLLRLLSEAGNGQLCAPGIYAQVTGPCYETPAEIRALQICGADVVGMSSCRETNRAFGLKMECATLSCVTNRAAGLTEEPIHHDEVMAMGRSMEDRVMSVIEAFLSRESEARE
jgi:purine-nucleoside phosphorylase